jgi:hypothetical protein
MLRMVKDLARAGELDDTAEVHHGDTMADVLHARRSWATNRYDSAERAAGRRAG